MADDSRLFVDFCWAVFMLLSFLFTFQCLKFIYKCCYVSATFVTGFDIVRILTYSWF
jgi:hypothetical protein